MSAVVGNFFTFFMKIGTGPVGFLAQVADYLFSPFTNENGLEDRRIWWILSLFFWTSLAVTVFAVGGLISMFVGLTYIYIIAFKKIKCVNNNIPLEDCV